MTKKRLVDNDLFKIKLKKEPTNAGSFSLLFVFF